MMILRFLSLSTVVIFVQLLLLSVKVSHVCKLYADYVRSQIFPVAQNEEYDFIVVGGGSAGSVVANRLSKYNRVLLIEYGGTPFYANDIPMMAPLLIHSPEVDFMYETVQQNHASFGTVNKISNWPRGKLLGGSSNLNYIMYVRGHPYDYDHFANLTKDKSWSYEQLLPLFKRSIDYQSSSNDDVHYGYSYGTQRIEPFEFPPYKSIFMKAGKELGFQTNIDLNAPQRSGFGDVDGSKNHGKRESSYTAFLQPILNRENLVISKYSQAVRVKLDKNNRAEGVWYRRHGKEIFARASKEVIVSAGSIDSPKLLMLSGIGPKNDLKKLGIKSLINLPVGENLKDHVISFIMPFTSNASDLFFRPDRDLGIGDLWEFYAHGTGVLSFPLASLCQAFFTSEQTKKETGLDWTDFQLMMINSNPHPMMASDLSQILKLEKSILNDLFAETVRKEEAGFLITLTLGRPKSKGKLRLKSKDPLDHPIINPNYLSHKDDITRYVAALKFTIDMVEKTKAFQEIDAKYANAPIKVCSQHKFRSDQYWECYLRHISLSMYHPVSTCKMGYGENDPTSVVDSKLRVLHAKNLRVADASILPDLINGNTNAPSVLVGEKAADLIRTHWANQYLVTPKLDRLVNFKKMCFYSRLP